MGNQLKELTNISNKIIHTIYQCILVIIAVLIMHIVVNVTIGSKQKYRKIMLASIFFEVTMLVAIFLLFLESNLGFR